MPDPLVMFNGERVTCKEQWVAQRRPELKALFQHYMYGYMPEAPAHVEATLEREDKQYFGGKATKKEVALKFGPPNAPVIHLLIVVPNKRQSPAPIFVGFNFCGNHTLLNDPTIALPQVWTPNSCAGCKDNHASDAGRGTGAADWAIEGTIDRGYAVASFYGGDVDPDRPDARGIQLSYPKDGLDWGTIAAWSWGMQRAVDYLVTDADIDKTKIVAVGHSRMGKAAMLAAAFDERIAMAIPLQAGCGGTAPSRGKVGEPVARINAVFPHWFNAEFKKFNEHTELLPFDQNCLVALMAPRPVLFSCAVEDTWANPAGQFEVLKAADPVYRFLGVSGLDTQTMPATGELSSGTLGYFIRPGKHSMHAEDWKAFMDFADKHFKLVK